MTSEYQVRCINKQPRNDPHHRITHLGGLKPGGTRWKVTEEEAIPHVQDQSWPLYVDVGGRRVRVIVATHLGRKYLKTEADGDVPNNLLSLPECP